MRLQLFTLMLLLSCSFCKAQETDTYKVLITVTDSVTQEKLGFAHLKITSDKDSLFRHANSDGVIEFELLKGHYSLEISYLGYQAYKRQVFINKRTEISVAMQPGSQYLSEVVVQGRKPLITILPNSITYDISRDKIARATNLLLALKRVPLVNIDANDNITVKGSSSYSIYLNGRPYRIAQANPKEVL